MILTGVLGLGVRGEAVDCALTSTTLTIDGTLPDQVSSVGRSQGRPLALGPAVAGLALGFGARGGPGTVYRVFALCGSCCRRPFLPDCLGPPVDPPLKSSATSFDSAGRLSGRAEVPGAPWGLGGDVFLPVIPLDWPLVLLLGAAGIFSRHLGPPEGCYSRADWLSPGPSPGSLARCYWSGTWRWWYH